MSGIHKGRMEALAMTRAAADLQRHELNFRYSAELKRVHDMQLGPASPYYPDFLGMDQELYRLNRKIAGLDNEISECGEFLLIENEIETLTCERDFLTLGFHNNAANAEPTAEINRRLGDLKAKLSAAISARYTPRA